MEKRNYTQLSHRLEALSGSAIRVETAGSIEEYPLHVVHLQENADASCTILLTAGVHGDEPAGVEAALRFLEQDQADLLQHFAFCVVPCINPTGYVRNTRENSRGADINRSFEADQVPEAEIVKELLRGRQFDCFIDFHEDWEAKGFYLYEGRRNRQFFGSEIIRHVEKIGPIDLDIDEGDPPISRGVYPVSSSWGLQGLAPYILHFHAPRAFICETPSTNWDMDLRVAAHLAALDTVLEHYRNI